MATRGPQKRVRRRERKNVANAKAHIKASFNNTIINITDQQGNTIVWTSGGSVGFKGSRKSTPYAAQLAAEEAARQAGEHGVRKIEVIISGTGPGKDAWRTLQHMGLEVSGSPRDATPTVHNGCRPKKRRRG